MSVSHVLKCDQCDATWAFGADLPTQCPECPSRSARTHDDGNLHTPTCGCEVKPEPVALCPVTGHGCDCTGQGGCCRLHHNGPPCPGGCMTADGLVPVVTSRDGD